MRIMIINKRILEIRIKKCVCYIKPWIQIRSFFNWSIKNYFNKNKWLRSVLCREVINDKIQEIVKLMLTDLSTFTIVVASSKWRNRNSVYFHMIFYLSNNNTGLRWKCFQPTNTPFYCGFWLALNKCDS